MASQGTRAARPAARSRSGGLLRRGSTELLAHLDLDFTFRQVNQSYAAAAGRDLVGTSLFDLHQGQGIRPALEQARDSGEPVRLAALPVQWQPDLTTFWDWTVTPLPGRGGRTTGLVLSLVEVTWHVDASRQLERELTGRLEEAQEARTLFFNALSHELRTPLTAMLYAVEVLKRPEAAERHRSSMLGILERNIRQQTRLIDDLLDLSRILRGKVQLERGPADLRDILIGEMERARPRATKAGLELVVQGKTPRLPVLGDRARLGQVLANLLDNAIKFTEHGGTIQVSAGARQGEAWVRVEDTGVGIPAGLLPYIFDPFSQADTGLGRTRGGLGLGLPLARALAQLHDGDLQAASPGPGRGSELVLRLPLRVPGTAQQRVRPVQGQLFGKKRVLVIEDNPDLRQSLVIMLELMGYTALQAADGNTGVELALRDRPETAIIDIGLPDIDGYEVARRLRAGPGPRQLIALTGYAAAEHRERAMAAGFDHHLAKPVGLDKLRLVLER